jgi:hypothetical protein
MATITVDQQKLVLNAFAATFQNNLLAKDIVSWKQYNEEMSDRNGLKVSEQVGPRYTVTRTSSAVNDLTSSGVQDSVFGSEQFTVQDVFGASMGWADFVKIRDIGEARENTALTNAATNLAEQIDAYILKTAALAANNEVGTAGNNVATWSDVVSGYTRLKKEGVDDSDLRMVLTYDDKQALGATVVAYTAPDDLATRAFRQGFSGDVGGLPTMFTQQLSNITPGSRTNGTVSGANQNVNYSAVAVSGAPGQYMTQTIAIAGLGAAGTIADGEIFTIANVFAYDNRLQQTMSHLQQFRVIGAVTADGAGLASAVRIFPAIIVPATGGGNTALVNSAHATVGTVPANAAVVTFRGTAATAYKPRLIIQKQAIVCNTADLIMPATGTAMRKALTQVPLSIRMWQDSTFNTGSHQVRFDVALTANVRDRRRVVRLNGA